MHTVVKKIVSRNLPLDSNGPRSQTSRLVLPRLPYPPLKPSKLGIIWASLKILLERYCDILKEIVSYTCTPGNAPDRFLSLPWWRLERRWSHVDESMRRELSCEVTRCGRCGYASQSRQWVNGSWVNGSNGSQFWMGHMGHGSRVVGHGSLPLTHCLLCEWVAPRVPRKAGGWR